MNRPEISAFSKLEEAIFELAEHKKRALVGIDGRCASGKTSLSKALSNKYGYSIFHMDDYFLRPEQRNEERLATPGGNVDHERFSEEILKPLARRSMARERAHISYRPFDCVSMSLRAPVSIFVTDIVVIEGSYALHPALWEYYDLHVFLTVSKEEQLRRIIKRNGDEKAQVFIQRWIPLEERYFSYYDIEELADLYFDTTNETRV